MAKSRVSKAKKSLFLGMKKFVEDAAKNDGTRLSKKDRHKLALALTDMAEAWIDAKPKDKDNVLKEHRKKISEMFPCRAGKNGPRTAK